MDLNAILIAMASMGGLGILFSSGLSIANKKLHVEEDPRIAMVIDELPGANCGGCGLPGCAKFAECVVNGEMSPSACPVCSEDAVIAISDILGVEAEQSERMIARILCQGGEYETAKKGVYKGIKTCIAATFAGGGDELCSYGCIGFADCVESCPFDAMYMNDNGLPVVIDEKCTGCGNCVDACPRDIIELHPESHKLFVLCKNLDSPKESRKICTRACVGCAICVRKAGENNMMMRNNLAIVNYNVFGTEGELPTDKCPTDGLKILGSDSLKEQEKVSAGFRI
jgi:Na+-translocating ferredoxin:NAD+ oxidoreductase RNF subunit RnfB